MKELRSEIGQWSNSEMSNSQSLLIIPRLEGQREVTVFQHPEVRATGSLSSGSWSHRGPTADAAGITEAQGHRGGACWLTSFSHTQYAAMLPCPVLWKPEGGSLGSAGPGKQSKSGREQGMDLQPLEVTSTVKMTCQVHGARMSYSFGDIETIGSSYQEKS